MSVSSWAAAVARAGRRLRRRVARIVTARARDAEA